MEKEEGGGGGGLRQTEEMIDDYAFWQTRDRKHLC